MSTTGRCVHHTLFEAAATCSLCGRAFCAACLVAGATPALCRSCGPVRPTPAPEPLVALSPSATAPAAGPLPIRHGPPSPDTGARPNRLRRSWWAALAGAGLGVVATLASSPIADRWLLLPTGAYAAWALYWSLPAFWRKTRPIFSRHWNLLWGSPNRLSQILGSATLLCCMTTVAWFYALCGGGLVHFVRYRMSLHRRI